MSFAKIAEGRAVKKIVKMIRDAHYPASPVHASGLAEAIADRIEAGEWKDVKLPKPKPRKKKVK
jgi:hypothetical protein